MIKQCVRYNLKDIGMHRLLIYSLSQKFDNFKEHSDPL
jgi:hypothetical protein